MYSRLMQIALCTVVVTSLSLPTIGQNASGLQLGPEYKKWLNEDVRWIITRKEFREFRQLVGNDQRDQFVTQFWERRNPHPDTNANSFKQEHYRRLAFSNEHFAARIAGDHTDRGRIYIIFGPPDSIKGSATPGNSPQENWFYQHIEGVGDNISLEFVDECFCGAYELTNEPPEMNSREPWSAR